MKNWCRRLRRRWKIAATILLVLWIVVVFGVSDLLILGPRPGNVDAGTARRQFVHANDRAVEVWISRSDWLRRDEVPAAYVLEFCGNATRAEEIAQYVAQRWHRWPVEVWVMNYPGAGGTKGRFGWRTSRPQRWVFTMRSDAAA